MFAFAIIKLPLYLLRWCAGTRCLLAYLDHISAQLKPHLFTRAAADYGKRSVEEYKVDESSCLALKTLFCFSRVKIKWNIRPALPCGVHMQCKQKWNDHLEIYIYKASANNWKFILFSIVLKLRNINAEIRDVFYNFY